MTDEQNELVPEEEKPTQNEPVNRNTRRSYVFFLTLFAMSILTGMVIFGSTGAVAIAIANGLINIVELLVMFYVGASVLDRSDMLGKIGNALSKGGK
jgi:hypothetical protein